MATIKPTVTVQPSAIAMKPVSIPESFRYYLDLKDDVCSGVTAVRSALESCFNAAENFNYRRAKADPMITLAANVRAVETDAATIASNGAKLLDNAKASLSRSTRENDAAIKARLNLKPDAKSPELRSVLRAMPVDQREAAVREAFRSGDMTIIAAIIGEHSLTTGVKAELIEAEMPKFTARFAPAETAIANEAAKAARYLDNAIKQNVSYSANIFEGTPSFNEKRAMAASIAKSYDVEYAGPMPVIEYPNGRVVVDADPKKPAKYGDGSRFAPVAAIPDAAVILDDPANSESEAA